MQVLMGHIFQATLYFGPESIADRKMSRNLNRLYVGGPLGILGPFILVTGIMFGYSPFIGLNVMVWAVAMILNQIMWVHGFNAKTRSMGKTFGVDFWARHLGWVLH